MKYLLYLCAICALFMHNSCKPVCQKWLSKNGHMLRDTVTTYSRVTDTVTMTLKGDTITLKELMRDTIVHSGRATIQLKFDTLWRIKFLQATCSPDTIFTVLERWQPIKTIRETPIVPERIVYRTPWWIRVLVSICLTVSILLIIKLALR